MKPLSLCRVSFVCPDSGPSRGAMFAAATLIMLTMARAQPNITNQPADRFLDPGKSVSLAVRATGRPPLVFQWLFNDRPLNGATNSALVIPNAQPNLNGEYRVVVSDSTGSVTSQVARVKVFVPAPHRFASIQARAGEPARLAMTGETVARFAAHWDLYPLEVSSNLVDWLPLTTLVRANTTLEASTFSDTNADVFSRRFYRMPTNLFIAPFPEPTGPFAVGTFSRVIGDPARPTDYRYNKKTNVFMVTCWYPAERQTGLMPVAAWDGKVASDSVRYQDLSIDAGWAAIVPQFRSYALPEAPVVRGTDRYPVILHSHGYICHRKSNSHDAEELASHGYVVVAVDHEDCWGTAFPDGRYLRPGWNLLNMGTSVSNLIDSRVKDLLCALDELRRWDASDPWLAGRLDLHSLGLLGYSRGGSSAASLVRTNDAVRCAALLDPDFHFEVQPELKQTGLGKPFLIMNNDFATNSGTYYWPDSVHLFGLAETNAIICQIRRTSHYSFFDFGWIFPVTQPWSPLAPGTSRLIDACLVSFFNRYLKGQDDHFLDQSPPKYLEESCEVLNFQRK